MRRKLLRYLKGHSVVTMIVMALAFIGFAGSSVNLLMLLHANAEFIFRAGWWALRFGALEQLAGLLLNGFIALTLYLLFKSCEKILVEKITHLPAAPSTDPPPAEPERKAEHGERP